MASQSKSSRAGRALEFVAYHEAGHAVACLEQRRAFRRVTIEPGEDSLGAVILGRFGAGFRPDTDLGPRARRAIEREVFIGMAGLAAERRRRGRRNWGGASSDLADSGALASYLYEGEVLAKYVAFMVARADAWIATPPAWTRVEALAGALLENRTLSGRQAREVCRGAIRRVRDEAAGR